MPAKGRLQESLVTAIRRAQAVRDYLKGHELGECVPTPRPEDLTVWGFSPVGACNIGRWCSERSSTPPTPLSLTYRDLIDQQSMLIRELEAISADLRDMTSR